MSTTRRRSAGRAVAAAFEVVVTVALATALVAALDAVAPLSGLAVVYLLAVLTVAIRRGWPAALATAVVSVLAFNYFFIAPVHRLTIADRENVAALLVFLVVAVVVGRLAGRGPRPRGRGRGPRPDRRPARRRGRDARRHRDAAA